jgi:hypothetical protein
MIPKNDQLFADKIMRAQSSMNPNKAVPDLIWGGYRFLNKIMFEQKAR